MQQAHACSCAHVAAGAHCQFSSSCTHSVIRFLHSSTSLAFADWRTSAEQSKSCGHPMLRIVGVQSATSAHAHSQHRRVETAAFRALSGTAKAPARCHARAPQHDATARRQHAVVPQDFELSQRSADPVRPHRQRSHRQRCRSERVDLRCSACQQEDAAASAPAVTAGIPLSGEVLTAPGQRLAELLLDGHMQDFVSCVRSALTQVSRHYQELAHCHAAAKLLHSFDEITRGTTERSACAGCHVRLVLGRDLHSGCRRAAGHAVRYLHSKPQNTSRSSWRWSCFGIPCTACNQSCPLQTYTAEPAATSRMAPSIFGCRHPGPCLGGARTACCRTGADRKLLRTRVQFLAGHKGQYQLGSVSFR